MMLTLFFSLKSSNTYTKRFFYTVCIVFLSFNFAYSQFNENIFYDTITKVSSEGFIQNVITEGKYFYIGGSSYSEKNQLPSIIKMDTSGLVIWTTHDEDNYARFANYPDGYRTYCDRIFKSENKIYSLLGGYGYHPELWCISDSSGAIIWKIKSTEPVKAISDYNSQTLIVITDSVSYLHYNLIDKANGNIIFSKSIGYSFPYSPNVFVDINKNILISYGDTCFKYKDDKLSELVWKSNIPNNGTIKLITQVIQDSSQYIFFGHNMIRAVDTATGISRWFTTVNVGFIGGVQSGEISSVRSFAIKDSSLYVTWCSVTVGGSFDKGFTLTKINKRTGIVKYNVSYDFKGIPADNTSQDYMDWPVSLAIDENTNVYLTGSYDNSSGIQSPGNWGIMKINGKNGALIFESTITQDSSTRAETSFGRHIYYYKGKMYCLGNSSKKGNLFYTNPQLVVFDTLSKSYSEKYRLNIHSTIRYSSSLEGLIKFGNLKMALLKKIGKSSELELRTINNQLLWSVKFNSANEFVIPQNITLTSKNDIAISLISYKDHKTKVLPGAADSLWFVRVDSLGKIKFKHQIKISDADSIKAYQVYNDPQGTVNFVYKKICQSCGPAYVYSGYTLDSIRSTLSYIGRTLKSNLTRDIKLYPIQHLRGDTMITFQAIPGNSPTGWLQSSKQLSSYNFYGWRLVPDFTEMSSTIKVDSLSYIVMGKDANNYMLASRYNYLTNGIIWSKKIEPGLMYNSVLSGNSMYTVSKKADKNILLNKVNLDDGQILWTNTFAPAVGSNKEIIPTDIRFNQISKSYSIVGYLSDSSGNLFNSSYFYRTLDSNGNILKYVERKSEMTSETKLKVVEGLQNGFTVYGGTLATSAFGGVGIYFSEDHHYNILPVGIRNFMVSNQDSLVFLHWQASTETNSIMQYNVQRSTDARNFTTVGTVLSAGVNPTLFDYNFTDKISYLHDVKIVYYRLQQIDLNGTISFSEIRSISFSTQPKQFVVYPNPANSYFIVQLDNQNLGTKYNISLVNMEGKIVVPPITTTTYLTKIVTKNLAKGHYILVIETNKEKTTKTILIH